MKKDPRINTRSMTVKNYLVIFFTMLFFCGSYAGLYFLQIQENALHYIVLSMLFYVVVISALISVLFAVFRHHILMKPLYAVCEAARKMANGDFSVRIPTQRKDGKKDEFEVLFEDFNILAEELASTELMKNDFIANVSHEFKTPLAVIQNYATILQSEELSVEERQDYSNRIAIAASSLSTLVSNILEINRLENQNIKVNHKNVYLGESLSRSIINYDSLLDEKNIQLELDLNETIIVQADEVLLETVWNNLLSNAIKFSEVGGKIFIGMEEKLSEIIVTVSDNGCGMSEDSLEHVFDKFYQADTSHKTQGNGLGLTLVKRIINLMNGTIEVNSQLELGTTFKIKFNQKNKSV